MNDVLVLRVDDAGMRAQAKRHGLQVVVAQGFDVAFDRALFVEPGVKVPWHLVDYGLHFLERWDAAVPLWRYGVLAQDVGTPAERKRTLAVTKDLRVLPYAQELLFVRNSPAGLALLAAFDAQSQGGGEQGDGNRLAFLRAVYAVKPRLCVLPASWMGEERLRQTAQVAERRVQRAKPSRRVGALISIEIGPGRYVRCREADAEVVREWYRLQALRRAERRAEEKHADH